MELLKALKKDHSLFKGQLRQIKKALDEEETHEVKQVFHELERNLKAHSQAEERVLYELLETVDHGSTRILAFESAEEHHLIGGLLEKLGGFSPSEDRWYGTFCVFLELLQAHIKVEESYLFAQARKFCAKNRLVELGDEFQTQKEDILGDIANDRPRYYEEEREGARE